MKTTQLAAVLLVVTNPAFGADALPASQPSPARLVASIDVKDFGAETVRIGDLNDDGAADLLLVQSIRPTREITCLTAVTLDGKILWQIGRPSLDNGTIYSDLPVQIYDWDNDGHNEVLYIRQAKYIATAWDGKSPRERADRYEGKELWHRQQEPGDWAIAPIRMNWLGPDQPQTILVYGRWQDRPAVMYDGRGSIIGTFPMQYTPDRTETDRKMGFYAFGADVWGDARDEVILFGARGLCIYANPRPLADPALYNETLYPGM